MIIGKCFSFCSFRPEILHKYFSLRRMSVGISSVYSGTAENRKSEIAQAEGGKGGGFHESCFPFALRRSRSHDQKIPDPQLHQPNVVLSERLS